MMEYIYREFKIFYDIKPEKNNSSLYKAYGYAQCLKNKKTDNPKINFTTEFPTLEGVQEEIKKIIKEYIDFEWDQFHKLKNEFPKSNSAWHFNKQTSNFHN